MSEYTEYRKLYLREWQVWNEWKHRIKNTKGYQHVSIHPHYQGPQGFINLIDDIGARPSKDHELIRINKWNDYEPGNVAWELKSNHRHIRRKSQMPKDVFNIGRLKAKENGIAYQTYWRRIKAGWTVEDAATLPSENKPYKTRFVE